MAPTAGTLYEYDLMFATFQAAINAQFENLIPNSMTLGYTYVPRPSSDELYV
jgi:hypothetical protein